MWITNSKPVQTSGDIVGFMPGKNLFRLGVRSHSAALTAQDFEPPKRGFVSSVTFFSSTARRIISAGIYTIIDETDTVRVDESIVALAD